MWGSAVELTGKLNSIADIDPRLLEEALRRARKIPLNERLDSDALLSAIIAEAQRGTRDMYGLVAAATKVAAEAD
jgi:hypothetical protein